MVVQWESHSWLHTALQDPPSPGFLLITFVTCLRTPSAVNEERVTSITGFLFQTTLVEQVQCMNAHNVNEKNFKVAYMYK